MISIRKLPSIQQALFYLLLTLLPTQLGLHFWPSWALVLGRRVDYLSPTLFLTDVLIVSLLLCWLIEKVYWDWYLVFRKKKKFVFPQIPNTKTQILILFIMANIWFAASRPVALWTWIKFLEFFLLGVYIVKTKPDPGRVTLFLSIGVLYSSLLATTQFILQHSVGGILWFLGERTFSATTPGIAQIPLCLPGTVNCPLFLRPYATLPHPNALGGFLAVVLPLIFVPMCQRANVSTNKKVRIFLITTFIVGIIALALTFSRSAWVVGALAIALATARNMNKKILVPILILTSLFLLLMIQRVQLTDESVVVRQQLTVAAIKIWQSAPLLGVGLGNFLVTLPRFLPVRTIYFLQPVHNIYLLLLSEVGVVGLGLFGWTLWGMYRNVTRDTRHETRLKNKALHVTCLLSLVAFLVLGLIDHYPLTLQQGRLLLTLFVSLSLVVQT